MDTGERLWGMVTGYRVSGVVRAVAELGIAEVLAARALGVEDIATWCGTDPSATARLLRAAVALDLVAFDERTARFETTPLLDALRPDAPDSRYGIALGFTTPARFLPWADLAQSVRTGEREAPKMLGAELYDYLETHLEEGSHVTLAMTATTAAAVRDVAPLIGATSDAVVVDVGGAAGAFLHGVLEPDPTLRGVVLELPQVAARAAALNDLDTLLHLPGRGRGVPEFERLFRLAGLRLAEVVPTAGRFHVLEAVSRKVVRIQNNG